MENNDQLHFLFYSQNNDMNDVYWESTLENVFVQTKKNLLKINEEPATA